MTFLEYQELAMRTAVYPAAARVQYPAMKLAGEAGEAAGKLADLKPGGDTGPLLAELGDVLWYVAALTRDLGFEEPWMQESLATLEERSLGNVADLSLPGGVLRLVAAACDPVERYGKLIRDSGLDADGGVPREAAKLMLGSALVALRYLAVCAQALASSLEAVASENVAKLASRKARGVISGSGDTR